jgi:hypothetical protein
MDLCVTDFTTGATRALALENFKQELLLWTPEMFLEQAVFHLDELSKDE